MPLVAHYPLQETGTSTAYDVRGSNDGTLNGGVTQGATGLLGTTAYDFDGVDGHIQISLDAYSDEFSVNIWFYAHSVGSAQHMLTTTESSHSNGWTPLSHFGIDDESVITWWDGNSGWHDGSTTFAANEWHMATITGNGTDTVSLYLDGSHERTDSDATNAIGHIDELGRQNGGSPNRYYDGLMADVRIYDHALTPLEVQYLYEVVEGPSHLTTGRKVI